MLILIRYAPPFRRWHQRLGERLEAIGHRVGYQPAGGHVGRTVLAIERRLYGIVADWDALEPAPAAAKDEQQLTIMLAGVASTRGLVLRPEIDGAFGEAALLAAARSGTAPHIAILGGPPDRLRLLVCGRPAMEDRLVIARALEDLLPRLVTLLVQAVARLEGAEPTADLDERAVARRVAASAFLARGLRHKLVGRLGRRRGRPAHWRIALRRESEATYRPMPDDPARFRADPFLFEDAGRLWLFFEDYLYATGKGSIGRLAIAATDVGEGLDARVGQDRLEASGGSGSSSEIIRWPIPDPAYGAGEARIVLEESFHLSYPLVLRHGGTTYMMPETSAASCVQLYRADPFPDRWVPDAVLLDGVRLADATPILHDGRWWLFATSTDDGGSSWDQLHLFHAPDLLGPWTPHGDNPVLIDAGAARPAGAMWHADGVLMRPAQDCRRGYGDGLAICRVDRLDKRGYRQTVVRRIGPPPELGANGIHTFNTAAGWEAVDLKVPQSRL